MPPCNEDTETFEAALDQITAVLKAEIGKRPLKDAKVFENRVREVAAHVLGAETIDFDPAAQAFPDIAIGRFGIEVKFTTADSWRSVANSVLETNRVQSVERIYLVFGKMGGTPDVKWAAYDQCVMHVRTSHVPRFEVEIGTDRPLFDKMGVTYDEFRAKEMHEKMRHIRDYARGRLRDGERLWWLEDSPEVRLFTELSHAEKQRLRGEAILLHPQIVGTGRDREKYGAVALFMLTYYGVLCHQTRDMFSAGSVVGQARGGLYVERMLKRMEPDLRAAAARMEDALFEEYWGQSVPPENRIAEWLKRADKEAKGWVPSKALFRK
ncbi:MAG: hypothetical protein LDL39_12375 [Magnetospirillum sp.]|nr:hypothetical protein [Magnetospirillum sp.]